MSRVATFLLGIAFWSLIIYLGISAYRWFVPPPILQSAVSISFPEAGPMVIEGRAVLIRDSGLDDTGPVEPATETEQDWVKLTVRRTQPPLTAIVLTDIGGDGRFYLSNESPLTPFKQDQKIYVRAEMFIRDGETIIDATESAAWNTEAKRALVPVTLTIIIVLIAVFLFFVYTGEYNKDKNRIAIGTAYIIIGVALLLPFTAPFALSIFPDAVKTMAESPVGLVKVHWAGEEGTGVLLDQWALNIGGIPQPLTNTPAKGDGTSNKPPTDLYNIRNGIVIPLYVLVLAILGGAVNMTRELPKLQCDLASTWTLLESDLTMKKVMSLGQMGDTPEDTGKITDDQDQSSDEVKPAEANDSKELMNKMNESRGDLIKQHMYLITAPFLAIITYYLLFMVEGKLAESIPIVVIISFSAGLLSETVVSTISEYADYYLVQLRKKLNPAAKDS